MEYIPGSSALVKASDARAREIKGTLRQFSYGLYVVTVRTETETGCMTANWVSQCSVSPPMLVIAMEMDSHTLALTRLAKVFCVSLLEASQRRLAARIAKPWARSPDKLIGVEMVETSAGLQIPAGAAAWVACGMESELPTGDHVLVTARVTDAGPGEGGEALTLLASGFRYG